MAKEIKKEPVEVLNEKWESFIDTYDRFSTQLDTHIANQINTAITKWQDFYYGQYGDWGSLDKWNDLLSQSFQVLEQSILNLKLKAKKPINEVVTTTKKVTILPETTIFGRAGFKFKPILAILAGISGLGLFLAYAKKK